MRSVRLFFPPRIMEFMNLVTVRSWYFGSGRMSLRLTSPLRGMVVRPPAVQLEGAVRARGGDASCRAVLLRFLCSVLRAALPSILNADRIESAANDVVAHAWEVLHAA